MADHPRRPSRSSGGATTDDQETITGTLRNILAKASGLRAPAVIVIGDVVTLRERLQEFNRLSHAIDYGPRSDGALKNQTY